MKHTHEISHQLLIQRSNRWVFSLLTLLLLAVLSIQSASAATQFWATNGPVNSVVWSLEIDPNNPNLIYAGTNQGVYKSTDGGNTWTATSLSGVNSPNPVYIALDPSNTSTLYATLEGGFYKSTDGGVTFTQSDGPAPGFNTVMAVDPTNSNIVYGGLIGGWSISKSTDGGATWTPLFGCCSFVTSSLLIDPNDPQTVYLGGGGFSPGLFKTTDGGATWTNGSTGLTGVSIRSIAIDPNNPNTLYAAVNGTNGGVFKSTDGGLTWSAINNGLTPTDAYPVVIDPTDSNKLYTGTFGGGVFESSDGGASWSAFNNGMDASHLRVYSFAIDPTNSNKLYAGTVFGGVYTFPNVADSDNDGVSDDVDNCPADPNPGQEDLDGDGIGDVCDPDRDGDSVDNVNDAFPDDPTESVDTDGDGIGNNADTDDDNDGQSDADETACGSDPLDANSTSPDADGDNIPDCVDGSDEISVDSFTLIDADTNQPIAAFDPIPEGATLDLSTLPRNLNIRANVSNDPGSVFFDINRGRNRYEKVAPFALAGDHPAGDYFNWRPKPGDYTLTATPYPGQRRSDPAGIALTLNFTVIAGPPPVVESFTLINADTNQPIPGYENMTTDQTIDLTSLPTQNLNLRADVSGAVKSVMFELNGRKHRIENQAPYALYGDRRGDYFVWSPSAGAYTVEATPFTKNRARGDAGVSLEITLTFTD